MTADRGLARLRNRAGEIIAGRSWGDEASVVETKNWVTLVLRERGKIVGRREGKNVWTNTGREYSAMRQSYASAGTPFRYDHVAYVGVGTGTQFEAPGVISLVTPHEFITGMFLAALDIPPTFPLTPSRTTVRYRRTFLEREITTLAGSRVDISELGLFTDGSAPTYVPGTRNTSFGAAIDQAPVAYKTFEPIGKTDTMQLEVDWEIRF